MQKKTRRIIAWQWPPRSSKPVLRTRETFPGISFLKKGVRWLDFSLPSDYRPIERKKFAKSCFEAAINRCNIAFQRARKAGKREQAAYFGEMITWIEQQYLNTL